MEQGKKIRTPKVKIKELQKTDNLVESKVSVTVEFFRYGKIVKDTFSKVIKGMGATSAAAQAQHDYRVKKYLKKYQ